MKTRFLLVCLILALPIIGWAEDADAYRVAFEGEMPKALRDAVKDASLAVDLQRVGSVSRRILRQRAAKDVLRFEQIMQAAGHYGARVRFEIEESSKKLRLIYRLSPGFAYQMGSVQWMGVPPGLEVSPPGVAGPATTAAIREVGQAALKALKNRGYPWAVLVETRIVPNHDQRRVDLIAVLKAGADAKLGTIHIDGLKRVRASHVSKKIKLQPGEMYRSARLAELRDDLMATSLFNQVDVSPGEQAEPDGAVSVWVELQERRFRTMFASASYQSDRGGGGATGFEHRNLRGRGEVFKSTFSFDELSLAWRNHFSKPDFLRQKQVLSAKLEAEEEKTDAFESRTVVLGTSLARPFGRRSRASLGGELRDSEVKQDGENRDFLLALIPITYERNTSGSLLDPQHGYALGVKSAPYFNLRAEDVFFFKSQLSWRQYLPLLETPSFVLAGRLVLGGIFGTTQENVPAHERFFAGGGGSVRGYGYQSIGPLNDEGNPLGGRSLLETSLELRGTLYKPFGFVIFWDGGAVGTSYLPGDGSEFRDGVGTGLRYQTPLGPIRADVAIPLDRRPEVDRSWQFYISLGQAF